MYTGLSVMQIIELDEEKILIHRDMQALLLRLFFIRASKNNKRPCRVRPHGQAIRLVPQDACSSLDRGRMAARPISGEIGASVFLAKTAGWCGKSCAHRKTMRLRRHGPHRLSTDCAARRWMAAPQAVAAGGTVPGPADGHSKKFNPLAMAASQAWNLGDTPQKQGIGAITKSDGWVRWPVGMPFAALWRVLHGAGATGPSLRR